VSANWRSLLGKKKNRRGGAISTSNRGARTVPAGKDRAVAPPTTGKEEGSQKVPLGRHHSLGKEKDSSKEAGKRKPRAKWLRSPSPKGGGSSKGIPTSPAEATAAVKGGRRRKTKRKLSGQKNCVQKNWERKEKMVWFSGKPKKHHKTPTVSTTSIHGKEKKRRPSRAKRGLVVGKKKTELKLIKREEATKGPTPKRRKRPLQRRGAHTTLPRKEEELANRSVRVNR